MSTTNNLTEKSIKNDSGSEVEGLPICPVLDEEAAHKISASICSLVKLPHQAHSSTFKKVAEYAFEVLHSWTASPGTLPNFSSQNRSGLISAVLSHIDVSQDTYSRSTGKDLRLNLAHALLSGIHLIEEAPVTLNKLIDSILKYPLSGGWCLFFRRLWQSKDLTLVSIELLERLISEMPALLEDSLLTLMHTGSGPRTREQDTALRTALQDSHLHSVTTLCSRSPAIFQAATSILNQLLQLRYTDPGALCTFQEFGRAVQAKGGCLAMSHLYPTHLQPLVRKLHLRPCSYPAPDRTGILIQLARGLLFQRPAFVCILVLHEHWIPHLLQFCFKTGIAQVISPELKSVNQQCT